MAKRKLSDEEKERIAEDRRNREVATHPDKMISVRVEDETDEKGEPVVEVHYIGEQRSKVRRRDET
jgi:hypothetical protein